MRFRKPKFRKPLERKSRLAVSSILQAFYVLAPDRLIIRMMYWRRIMPKNAILLAVLVIVFTCIAAIPVYAGDLISAEDPDGILGIARGFGGANLEKDGAGDPLIVGRIDGTKYGVYFFGCSDGKNCSTIQFSAGWSGEMDPEIWTVP